MLNVRLDETQAGIKIAGRNINNLASLVAQTVKRLATMPETWVRSLGQIPGSGRFSGEGNGNPLQYSCLENPMDGGAW